MPRKVRFNLKVENFWDALPLEGEVNDDDEDSRGGPSSIDDWQSQPISNPKGRRPSKSKGPRRSNAVEDEEIPELDFDNIAIVKTSSSRSPTTDYDHSITSTPSAPTTSSSPLPAAVPSPIPALPHVLASKKKASPGKGRALDLFSGTGSVAKRLRELGYSVTTLDFLPKNNPDIVTDLLEWEYKQFPPKHFKVIAASVPCAQYSVAKTTAPRDLPRADALVCRVLEIVKYFQPKTWWIENL